MWKTRGKTDEEEVDYFHSTPIKRWSIGLVKFVSFLVTLMAGVVLGLSLSTNFSRYYNLQTELFFPRTMYMANCDKDCLSMKSFLGPTHLMHGMTDEELFWRASLVPKMEEYPFERVPKVAFLFLTRGPLPFKPLWERFFMGHKGLYSIYIHSIPDYKLNVTEDSVFYSRQIPSEVRLAILSTFQILLSLLILTGLVTQWHAFSLTISYMMLDLLDAGNSQIVKGKSFSRAML